MWPSLRRPSLRHGVLVIGLVGCVGLAVALASVASDQRDNSLGVRAPDTRPEPGSSARAAAGLVHRGGESAEAFQLDDETTGSVGAFRGLSNMTRAALPLSDEDRFHIYEGVMLIPDAPVADTPAAEVEDSLSSEVALQDLPSSVIRKIPRVEGHKFVKFDDRIVVVNPASRIVVAMIPRYKLLQ